MELSTVFTHKVKFGSIPGQAPATNRPKQLRPPQETGNETKPDNEQKTSKHGKNLNKKEPNEKKGSRSHPTDNYQRAGTETPKPKPATNRTETDRPKTPDQKRANRPATTDEPNQQTHTQPETERDDRRHWTDDAPNRRPQAETAQKRETTAKSQPEASTTQQHPFHHLICIWFLQRY